MYDIYSFTSRTLNFFNNECTTIRAFLFNFSCIIVILGILPCIPIIIIYFSINHKAKICRYTLENTEGAILSTRHRTKTKKTPQYTQIHDKWRFVRLSISHVAFTIRTRELFSIKMVICH